jgi:hypothetical protein
MELEMDFDVLAAICSRGTLRVDLVNRRKSGITRLLRLDQIRSQAAEGRT